MPEPEPESLKLPRVGSDSIGIRPSGGTEMSLRLTDAYVFAQRDPKWENQTMGSTDDRVGDYGCTLTALAMAASNLGAPTDPGALNTALSANGGYTDRGWLIWGAVPKVTQGQIEVVFHDEPSHAAIDACLTTEDGYPLVKFMLGGRIQHWVVVVGKERRSWLIRDPLLMTDAPLVLEARAPKIRAVRCVRRAG